MLPTRTTALVGATVWVGPWPAPRPATLLLRDGRIAALAAPDAPPPPDADVVDLRGRHVVPGFVDAHTHLSASALLPVAGDASGWRRCDDARTAVRAAAGTAAPGAWLLFLRMTHETWDEPVPPTAADLEAASGGRPVLLADLSLHRGVLSESGLRRCGVTTAAPDPWGDVVRGRGGVPTGLVWERAFGAALYRCLRDVAAAMAGEGLDGLLAREAARHVQLGIVRAHEPGVPSDVDAALARVRRATPLRLSWAVTGEESLLAPPDAPAPAAFDGGDGPASSKLFADGAHRCGLCLPVGAVLGVSVAAVRHALLARDVRPLQQLAADPMRLAGRHVHVPWLRFDDAALHAVAARHADAGRRLRIHALGNLAAQQAARLLRALGPGAGATLEHVMGLADADCDAVAATGAPCSLQPGFIPHYGPILTARGMVGVLRALPLASLARRGVAVSISSDNPCGPLDPLHNLRCAVTRAQLDGAPLDPDEALDRTAAVRAATIGGAVSIGLPEPGGITPGEVADLAVCDGDPFAAATRVVATWIGGRAVWSATD